MISQSDDIINELNRATVFSHLIIFLVLAEDKDMDTDVDASNYVSGDFFADGFLEYLPSGSRTKIETLVPVETYMCLDTSSAEETKTGAREPDNLGASSEMTICGPRNEPDGPPTSLGATESEAHLQQQDNTAVRGPRRSARTRTSTWNAIYRDFEPHLEKAGRCSVGFQRT